MCLFNIILTWPKRFAFLMGDGNAPATRYSGMLSHVTGKWKVTEAKKCGVHSYVVGKLELDQKWHSKVHLQF